MPAETFVTPQDCRSGHRPTLSIQNFLPALRLVTQPPSFLGRTGGHRPVGTSCERLFLLDGKTRPFAKLSADPVYPSVHAAIMDGQDVEARNQTSPKTKLPLNGLAMACVEGRAVGDGKEYPLRIEHCHIDFNNRGKARRTNRGPVDMRLFKQLDKCGHFDRRNGRRRHLRALGSPGEAGKQDRKRADPYDRKPTKNEDG